MDFIDDFKYKNNSYTNKIRDSEYIEHQKVKIHGCDDICEIIISNKEINYSLLNDNEKSKFIQNTKLLIASSTDSIDIKKKYNKKFTKSLITSGLQEKNMFSSILFLNEHYISNCIIYNKDTGKYYKTGLRNSEHIYCMYENNSWFPMDEPHDITISESIDDLSHIITMDITTNMIYNLYLKSLTNYKLDDLQTISNELDIPILNGNGKKKTKQGLYNEINLKKIMESI